MTRSLLSSLVVVLLVGFAPDGSRASDPETCSPAPQTGCFQSADVRVRASLGQNPRRDVLDWGWKNGEELGPDAFGDPRNGNDYALCLYDGDATSQTETEAPAPGTDSLLVSIDAPAGRRWFGFGASKFYIDFGRRPNGLFFGQLSQGTGDRVRFAGSGRRLGLSSLRAVDPMRVISQVQNADGSCWGAEVTVELRNAPPFSIAGTPSADVIDEAKARATLDDLASLYNRKAGSQGPLNMTLWSNALGATEIQNRVVTTDPADLDLQALSSALYVFGWYGGTLFQRDGFQANPGPAGPDPAAFANAVAIFRDGIDVSTLGTDQEVFDFLTATDGGGPGGTGTGVLASVESFGYNTGYGYAVLEDLIDVFNPPDDKLVCSGITARSGPNTIHPRQPFVPADAPLFDCTFTPSFLDAGPSLRPFLDDFLDPTNPNVLALPAHLQPAALKTAQDNQEGQGQFVWKVLLSGVIRQDQAYRASLWDVDNAFLEVVEAAGLTGLGALARHDAALGRRAVLAGGTVLEGWLAAYSFGLSAPSGPTPHDPATDPRVLPLFDLGTTPIESF